MIWRMLNQYWLALAARPNLADKLPHLTVTSVRGRAAIIMDHLIFLSDKPLGWLCRSMAEGQHVVYLELEGNPEEIFDHALSIRTAYGGDPLARQAECCCGEMHIEKSTRKAALESFVP